MLWVVKKKRGGGEIPKTDNLEKAIQFILHTSFLMANKSLLYKHEVTNFIQHPTEERQLSV